MTEMTVHLPTVQSGEQYSVQYDRLSDEPLSVAIADAVATVRDVEITTLEPLHYAIDTDALERLFEPHADGIRAGGSVSFEYNDCLVTVTADGEIRVGTF
ncbi:HalOD1 output domain-containing protein [Natrialbaceae archaeon A-arb3/5]